MRNNNTEVKSTFIQRPDDAVSLNQALEVIRYMSVEKGRAVIMWGPPGIGKTTAMQRFFLKPASEGGLGYDELRQIIVAWEDPTTGKGMPMIRQMKLNGDGSEIDVTAWAVSDVWAVPHSKKVAYFFDELPNAVPAVTSVFQKIIHEKKVGGIDISGCPIVAAGNDMTHGAGAYKLTTSMSNRLLHLNVWPDTDEFIEYAVGKNFHEWVVAYTRFQQKHPTPIYDGENRTSGVYDPLINFDPKQNDKAWLSPRSLEVASEILQTSMSETLKKVSIAGAAGARYQAGIYSYASIFSKLPDIDKILAGEDVAVPSAPDIRYATISSLVGRLIVMAGNKTNAEMQKEDYKPPKGFNKAVENVLDFAWKLAQEEDAAEFAVVFLKDSINAADEKIRRACGNEGGPFRTSESFLKLIKKFQVVKAGKKAE
jgi:hypothetical protein